MPENNKITVEQARRVIAEHEAQAQAEKENSPAWKKAAEMVAAGWQDESYYPKIDRRVEAVGIKGSREYYSDSEDMAVAAGMPVGPGHEEYNYDVMMYIIEMTEED
jgi:hypothetical protein